MSGRPDPAARWGEADVPGRGETDDGDTSAASTKDSAAGGPGPAPHSEASGPDQPEKRRGPRGVGGDPKSPGGILTDVAALTAERDDYLQSLQRLKADFDNYRKRVARLQEDQTARAAAALVQKLLPVLDNLDLAVAHLVQNEPETEDAWALAKSRDQLLDVLAKEGLERVDETEVPFDPTVHDAVAHTQVAHDTGGRGRGAAAASESNGDSAPVAAAETETEAEAEPAAGTAAPANAHEVMVDDVMRAGYRWRGQVLRPAMVRVRG
jgi:molecular chaperone GrpE